MVTGVATIRYIPIAAIGDILWLKQRKFVAQHSSLIQTHTFRLSHANESPNSISGYETERGRWMAKEINIVVFYVLFYV